MLPITPFTAALELPGEASFFELCECGEPQACPIAAPGDLVVLVCQDCLASARAEELLDARRGER